MDGAAFGQARARRRRASLAAACIAMTLSASSWVLAAPHLAEVEFQRLHPCPSNQARQGACPGYAIHHVVPLCLGGPDVPYNMRWQRQSELKRSDPADVRECRAPAPDAPSSDVQTPLNRT